MILLTGAPQSSLLDWSEEHLSVPLLEAFQERTDTDCPTISSITSSSNLPAWRRLPLVEKHLLSGLSQESGYLNKDLPESSLGAGDTSFLTTNNVSRLSNGSTLGGTCVSLSSDSGWDEALSQFYENSFLVHEDLPTPNVTALHSGDESTLGVSFVSVEDSQDTQPPSLARLKPQSLRLSTLCQIPNAAYLRSLEPQTVTVDLVVGILHISPPRWIKTCRDNRWVELVELTVADDTKAGFGISMWLSQIKSASSNKATSPDLRSKLTRTRPRDVVLIKNLALSSYQNRVHGQSLRKANTTLDLLFRVMVGSDDEPGAYGWRELEMNDRNDMQLGRVMKVQEWIMSFVGSGPHRLPSKTPHRKTRLFEHLPADTP